MGRLTGFLAVIVAAAAVASPTTTAVAAPTPSPCAEGEALEHLGRLSSAEAAYLRELKTAASADCAQRGLARLGRRPESCAYAASLKSAGERAKAHTAYLKVLEADPSSRCASAGVRQTAAATTVWSWLADAAPNAGKALAAIVVGFLLLAIVTLAWLQLQTRVPWLRDRWPAAGIRRPTLQIKAFDDAALDEHLGASVAGLIRGRVSWRKDRFGVSLVTGQAGVATALSDLGDVSTETKAAVAVVKVLTALLPRREFTLAGELQPASDEGRGISLELSQRQGFEALITFWADPLAVSEDARAADVYRALAVASAAWVDHWTASTIGGDDLLTSDPQSWAVFRCGLDAQRLGDEDRARVLYDRALVMDGTNVGAMANLGIIYRRRNEYEESHRCLRHAREATEDSGVAPKLKANLNPDWYRIKYQLAALYTNWTDDPDAVAQHDEHAQRAQKASAELARDTLEAIEKPPSLGIGDSVPNDYVAKTLLPFLEGTIEPSALVLVACTVSPVPSAPAQRPQSRPTRKEVLGALGSPVDPTPVDPWPLIAYVEMGEHLTPNAHFDLACFYVKANDLGKAMKRLQTAVRETAMPERRALIEVAKKDPTLKDLRDVRPGLIAKLEQVFIFESAAKPKSSEPKKLDDKSLELLKEFDRQSRVYEELVAGGWATTWLPASTHFTFLAEKDNERRLIQLASASDLLTDDHISSAVGNRVAFEEDVYGGTATPGLPVWVLLHADGEPHQCDGDKAASRGVNLGRLDARDSGLVFLAVAGMH